MIQAIMLIALGFLTATFIGVLLAPSLWSRAYRLSRRRLEQTLPLTLSEIEASRDQLRASYAVQLRRLETALASAKQKAAIQLVDNSRLQMQILALKDEIADLDLKLSERRNAAAVFEQTITKRLPELDGEIDALKAQLEERSYDVQDLTNKLNRRTEQVAAAERAAASYEEELNRLREALEKQSSGRSGRRLRRASQWDLDDYRAEYDRLNLELSKLRQQLAQYQDRDVQQAGLLKGELQKLAELILASAAPRGETRPSERLQQPISKRPHELPRHKPEPWPEIVSARSQLSVEDSVNRQDPLKVEPATKSATGGPAVRRDEANADGIGGALADPAMVPIGGEGVSLFAKSEGDDAGEDSEPDRESLSARKGDGMTGDSAPSYEVASESKAPKSQKEIGQADRETAAEPTEAVPPVGASAQNGTSSISGDAPANEEAGTLSQELLEPLAVLRRAESSEVDGPKNGSRSEGEKPMAGNGSHGSESAPEAVERAPPQSRTLLERLRGISPDRVEADK